MGANVLSTTNVAPYFFAIPDSVGRSATASVGLASVSAYSTFGLCSATAASTAAASPRSTHTVLIPHLAGRKSFISANVPP